MINTGVIRCIRDFVSNTITPGVKPGFQKRGLDGEWGGSVLSRHCTEIKRHCSLRIFFVSKINLKVVRYCSITDSVPSLDEDEIQTCDFFVALWQAEGSNFNYFTNIVAPLVGLADYMSLHRL